MAVRAFLGLCEGGMMPGVAYYLSTYYKRDELVLRIGIFGKVFNLLIPFRQRCNLWHPI
jgi:MFS family permease